VKHQQITWQDVSNLTSEIIRKMTLNNWKPDYVVGITRGGLIPAVMISQYYQVPCHTLRVSLRDASEVEVHKWMIDDALGDSDEEIDFFNADPTELLANAIPKNILIVDDINDTGATINAIMNSWMTAGISMDEHWKDVWNNNVCFAVLLDNLASQSKIKVDFIGQEINKAEEDVWVDYPWENWWISN